jgi:hypothetical protein
MTERAEVRASARGRASLDLRLLEPLTLLWSCA